MGSGVHRTGRDRGRLAASVGLALMLAACGTENTTPGSVPFDRIDVVARWEIALGASANTYVSADEAAGVWIEAFLEPDRGWGIFPAKGGTRIVVPDDDEGELRFDDFQLRLTTDDYTENGWLRGAHVTLDGTGRAVLDERRDEHTSDWRVTHMPRLILTDESQSIRGDFEWVEEAPTPELATILWLGTDPSSSHFYVRYARFRRVGAEEPAP